jgi:hypothetical protein
VEIRIKIINNINLIFFAAEFDLRGCAAGLLSFGARPRSSGSGLTRNGRYYRLNVYVLEPRSVSTVARTI